MKTLLEVLEATQAFFARKGLIEPRREAERLLMGLMQIDRLQMYCQADRPLEEPELQRLRNGVERRGQREPLAYIMGRVPFFGLEIEVNPSVLIPRFETEFLVDHVVKELQRRPVESSLRLLDLCTGSGCIALALKSALPWAEVNASDLSADAVQTARSNGQRLGLEVEWRCGDLADPWLNGQSRGAPFDVVVANPPYVAQSWREQLEPEVRREPELALFAEAEGMGIYERLAVQLPQLVRPGGVMWLEIGFDQGEKVQRLFAPQGRGTLLRDLEGRDRFFRLEVEGP
jgi:release factor glutamine methyltransferase